MEGLPSLIWISGSLPIAVCISAITLSIQRGLYHKHQQQEEGGISLSNNGDRLPLQTDYKRDHSVPFDDENRITRITYCCIIIDNIDIKDLGTEDLRSNLTIIPQDPTLFSGSLRSNMDPFNEFQDEDIFAALQRVHLIPSTDASINSFNSEEELNVNVFKDLDTNVSEGGKNFSQGQRQLLCLGRALLKSSRVVLMDEATASVDFETDKAIQKTIATEFSDNTILCIAHRLHTVIEYDRILLLDQGKIIEFDNPLILISNPESSFYKMCHNSGKFDSLLVLAKSKHQLVEV